MFSLSVCVTDVCHVFLVTDVCQQGMALTIATYISVSKSLDQALFKGFLIFRLVWEITYLGLHKHNILMLGQVVVWTVEWLLFK